MIWLNSLRFDTNNNLHAEVLVLKKSYIVYLGMFFAFRKLFCLTNKFNKIKLISFFIVIRFFLNISFVSVLTIVVCVSVCV